MSSIFKSIMKIAPIALPFIAPGIGTALGAALGAGATAAPIVGGSLIGAGTGALSGGGLKGALLGGATGGLAGGGSNLLAGASGLTGAGAKALSGALTGASGGYGVGGNLKSALLGAGLGGAGGYITGGGLSSGGLVGAGQMGPAAPTIGDKITMAARSPLATLTGQGAGGSSFGGALRAGTSILGAINDTSAQDKMKRQMLEAQGRAVEALQPYNQSGLAANKSLSERLAAGFNPGDLTQDPGYQFRLQEGQRALDRQAAAGGNFFSGAALKAAQDYGQGLADTTYNDAYNRWAQQNQQLAGQSGQGVNTAASLAGIYDTQGDIAANATQAKAGIFNRALSGLLSGSGATGRVIIGQRTDGTPIYQDELLGA